MTRQTSADAYRIICETGLLSASRLTVYRHLFEHGPLTRNELDRGIAGGMPNPTYSRRLAEMERMGALQRVGERPCAVTGYRSELWDVTDRLPRKDPKSKPTKASRQRLEALLAEIRAEIEGGGVERDPAGFASRWLGCLPVEAAL